MRSDSSFLRHLQQKVQCMLRQRGKKKNPHVFALFFRNGADIHLQHLQHTLMHVQNSLYKTSIMTQAMARF